ncbi:hypothetical protein FH972_002895 [Carpinus fangiana]|uniref:Uncharacterized protein n=1 Tax=Carpinus fangiana TaxID=176857 RepID=A0A5N6QJP7_9ROSI|nr:hypothetical protein FH972_002895 [Carpinus fangiana]
MKMKMNPCPLSISHSIGSRFSLPTSPALSRTVPDGVSLCRPLASVVLKVSSSLFLFLSRLALRYPVLWTSPPLFPLLGSDMDMGEAEIEDFCLIVIDFGLIVCRLGMSLKVFLCDSEFVGFPSS